MEQELQTAKNMGYKYGAKIVRGAYMDAERWLATQKGYEGDIYMYCNQTIEQPSSRCSQ